MARVGWEVEFNRGFNVWRGEGPEEFEKLREAEKREI